MTEATPQQAITRAAALLMAAARTTDPIDPGVLLRCLAAAECLGEIGSPPPHVDQQHHPVPELITSALELLAELPFEVFATDPVRTAAAHARRALLLLD
jgi:hypothetical protein